MALRWLVWGHDIMCSALPPCRVRANRATPTCYKYKHRVRDERTVKHINHNVWRYILSFLVTAVSVLVLCGNPHKMWFAVSVASSLASFIFLFLKLQTVLLYDSIILIKCKILI